MNGASARQCQGCRNSVNKTTVASFVICDFFFFYKTERDIFFVYFILYFIFVYILFYFS